jgi:hypothetical protein
VTAKLSKTAVLLLSAVILAACGSPRSARDLNNADSPASSLSAAASGASTVPLSQATAAPQYVAAGTVSSADADLDACKAWWLSPVPSKRLPAAVQGYDYDRPALRWLDVVSPPLAAALGAEQASDLAAIRSGSDSAPTGADPSALLQADAVGADCLSLYGSQLTELAAGAKTDLASLTAHVGNGFGQTACDLLSPRLLNQWYAIAPFGMNPGDSSVIDNVAMSAGVNQTGGSDCQYAWEPGYQLGGQLGINFYESQSPASVLQNIPDIGAATADPDIVPQGALWAESVGESPPFAVIVFPAGANSIAVSCTALTRQQCSFLTAVVALRLIAYHYPNDAVRGIAELP